MLEERFLLACSGGVDSMVLAHLCHHATLDFVIGHCNFQLRGGESDTDEKFVRNFAFELSKTFFSTCFETADYVKKNKVSVQIAARELRYNWFTELMQENDIKILVTAHQADDNLETFLINLSRGTGIDGLTGIPEKTDTLARPLLPFTRSQILEYARIENVLWREDGSNSDTKYLRNKIRHEIVPKLKELHPTFLRNFKNTQQYIRGTSQLAELYIDQIRTAIFRYEDGVIQIDIPSLLKLEPLEPHLFALFHGYGFTEWNDVKSLLTTMSGKEVRSKTHRLLKDREFLLLAEIREEDPKEYPILQDVKEIHTPIHLKITEVSRVKETPKNVLYVAKETLKYPLTLRKWQKGDYFYPLGMKGRKKVSKFFKDEKMDAISKEKQWLLCSRGTVVWVVGKRADERFKVSGDTQNIVKIEFNT
ncbi:tRNA lysidine(34) synthetase TilS [Ulvibacterium sp.]|uniref:tRNA lysidine(34) synthetase TilS n=1 Tax=Ulvibacterium sp. TaxID=2665914 RepID=UPI003BA91141